MFIISLSYKKPISEVLKHIEEHDNLLSNLDSQNKLIFSARKNQEREAFLWFTILQGKILKKL
jgi:uncharacterized protein YciI